MSNQQPHQENQNQSGNNWTGDWTSHQPPQQNPASHGPSFQPAAGPQPYTRAWTAQDIRQGPQPEARFGQPSTVPTNPPRRRRGWARAAIPAVALLAALAGGGIGAAIVGQDGQQVAGGTQLVQSDGSNPDWTQTASAASPSVVSIQVVSQQGASQGSGVILDGEGRLATNHHVVAAGLSGAQIQVTLADQTVHQAEIVGTDPSTDLAVLQLTDPPQDLTPVRFADSEELTVGQPVMAIGNPLGLSESATTGIVSATDRPVVTQTEQGSAASGDGAEQAATNAIQTNAAINPGNSGGALVNGNGELVGITSSIATMGGQGQSGNIGIGFAIPSNEVRTITDQLIEDGTADHAWLGVATTDEPAQTDEGTVVGAGVARVVDGSPASQAGIRNGDVITALDGEPVNGAESLMASVRGLPVGQPVTLDVTRNGTSEQVEVTLGNAPQ